MFFILMATAMMKCPATKTNIIDPMTPEDRQAYQEHSDRCLATKSWPCLYTFEKKGPHWYKSSCGSLVEDK